MNRKKWILLLIIAFPSMFWLILETSTINSKKLPVYGPRTLAETGDTVYHRVSDSFYDNNGKVVTLTPEEHPLYAVMFVKKEYRSDSYRLAGLWEFLNYKKEKIRQIPVVLVTESDSTDVSVYNELKKMQSNENVRFYSLPPAEFKEAVTLYFDRKPYYIDYSFFVLVDASRNVRGFYDGRYAAEIKRLIEEYKHLRIREEKQRMSKANEIRPK